MIVTSDQIYDEILTQLRTAYAASSMPLSAQRIYLADDPYFDESEIACVQVTMGATEALHSDPGSAIGLIKERFTAYHWSRVLKDPGRRKTQALSTSARSVLKMQTITRACLICNQLAGKAASQIMLVTGSPPLPKCPPGWVCKGETYTVLYQFATPHQSS